MQIFKSQLKDMIKELPEKEEIEDAMYRIYMLHKIELGEKGISEDRILSLQEAKERLSKKWRQQSGLNGPYQTQKVF
ncbi:MAG: hypothetical protein MRJ65_14000 [Candidatus Brocadiaceae bacterium]|nr:hypothetical protein [Candidatus Brocadiaceae bacterium]